MRTIDPDNPVNVIGHDDICIQPDMRDIPPAHRSDLATGIQAHLTIYDLTKVVDTVTRADGDEVCAVGGVVK